MAAKIKLRFRPGMTIGASAAEDDTFLKACFVSTRFFKDASSLAGARSILLGRTGSGKSAVVLHLETSEKCVVRIEPEALALNYLSGSSVLRSLESLGVNLDIFYRLLWRHILAVELLKYYFKLRSESDFTRMKDFIAIKLGMDKAKSAAFSYLEDWDSQFWAETEERIRHITSKLESDVRGHIGARLAGGLGVGAKFSEEEKKEVVNLAQEVVNKVQIKALGEIIKFLAEDVFDQPGSKCYLIIDKLDENWVDDSLRYRLIRALIETVKNFRKITNVRILVCLRSDLLDRVYTNTRDSGFQEEKYDDLNLKINWTPEELEEMLDKRVSHLIAQQYTQGQVRLRDVLPTKVGEKPILNYILERTLMRPRDAIAFVNAILEKGAGRTDIPEKIVRDAEASYSDLRKRALLFEWRVEHPQLEVYLSLLMGRKSRFPVEDISAQKIEDFAMALIQADPDSKDRLTGKAHALYDGKMSAAALRAEVLAELYKIGAIGIKPHSFESVLFSYLDSPVIDPLKIEDGVVISVHPMLWRALGVHKPRLGGSEES